ncbi:hypothetical protein E2C01_079888 [Portunus trituberculatus]|uniref:Uncharacterized protein n=1 Tax=Portunus trituberculatus TaxID=210409 RepID=A0A5B7IWU0_PORTR|nr:hypothetical protein [Portunus trituberculatus]
MAHRWLSTSGGVPKPVEKKAAGGQRATREEARVHKEGLQEDNDFNLRELGRRGGRGSPSCAGNRDAKSSNYIRGAFLCGAVTSRSHTSHQQGPRHPKDV